MLFYASKLFQPWYDANGEGGEGGNTDPDPKKPEGDPNANGGGQQPGNQEDLNKKFAERATRAAEAERKKLWDALGVTSQEEFDAHVKAKKDAEDKSKTALEKAATDLKDTSSKLAKEQADNETLRKRLSDGEIKFAAREAIKDKDGKVTRAAFRADAMDEVLLMIDRSEIKEEEGKWSGIDKALEKLAKAKPHWLVEPEAQAKPKGSPIPKTNGSSGGKQPAEERQPILNSL